MATPKIIYFISVLVLFSFMSRPMSSSPPEGDQLGASIPETDLSDKDLPKEIHLVYLINRSSGKYLGIQDCSKANGANVRQWESTGKSMSAISF